MKTKYRILGFIIITKVEYGRAEGWYSNPNPKPYIDWQLWNIPIYREYVTQMLY